MLAAVFAALPARAAPIEIAATPVTLGETGDRVSRVGALAFLGGLALTSPDRRFGGLSGLAISADGTRMTAITDRGSWITARLDYDAAGRLVGIGEAALYPIRDMAGQPLEGSWRDAEGLTRLVDGRRAVGFEQRHRIWLYGGSVAQAAGQAIAVPAKLGTAPNNGGIEALTQLADGRLLALTEDFRAPEGGLRGWIITLDGGGDAAPLAYPPARDFHPTALALLPGGDVLVLERRFTVVAGPGARLVRVARAAIAPGAAVSGRELGRLEAPLTVDNFEGLAVRRDAHGRTLIYLVSDDNFNPVQRTLLMQFRLAE
jgi:hypothetical protein